MSRFAPQQTIRRALFILAGTLVPFAAAQAVSPLGWEIPAPGTSARAPAAEMGSEPRGPSPLGFVIPQPGPRGAAGPLREDAADGAAALRDWNRRLAGIGGSDTN